MPSDNWPAVTSCRCRPARSASGRRRGKRVACWSPVASQWPGDQTTLITANEAASVTGVPLRHRCRPPGRSREAARQRAASGIKGPGRPQACPRDRRCAHPLEPPRNGGDVDPASPGWAHRPLVAAVSPCQDADRAPQAGQAELGAPKIREKLARLYPDVHTPAISTVHAILDRHGLVKRRMARRNRAKGTALSLPGQPNDLWCADYKGEFILADRRYCYPLTRRLRLVPPLDRSEDCRFSATRAFAGCHTCCLVG